MFSEKLPPIFTSELFMRHCEENLENSKLNSNIKGGYSYIYYENIRNINIPRPIDIPDPFAYHFLCLEIRKNWLSIKNHFKECTNGHSYKISRIHIRKRKDVKSLFKMNYNNLKRDDSPEIDLIIGSNYQINADISKCFQSIYTHSIPWALVGKKYAKERKNERDNWFNDLDIKTHNIRNDETHGLLIGPHASNLLSEIILCKVDDELYKKGWKFLRYIDDYKCYVTTEG